MAKKFKMKTTAKKTKEQKKSVEIEETKKMTFKPVTNEKVEENEQPSKTIVQSEEKQTVKKMTEETKEKHKKKSDEELKVKMAYPKGMAGTWQERFEGIMNDLINRMERLENSHNTLSDEINEIRENVNELETNIHELTALYDAISAQYNPFIDLTPQERRVIGGSSETMQVESDVNNFDHMENDIPDDLSEELTLEAEPLEEELPPAESFEEVVPQAEIPMPPQKGSYILPDIPENSLSHMTAIKWTEFMLEKVGATNIRKLLEYYRDLRWISERVMNKILHQVLGLNTEAIEAEYDTWKMSTDDHMKTLVFIEKIKGGDVGTIHAEEVQDWADDIKRG